MVTNYGLGVPSDNRWLSRLADLRPPVPEHPLERTRQQAASPVGNGVFSQRASNGQQNFNRIDATASQGIGQFATQGLNALTAEKDVQQAITQQGGAQGVNSLGVFGNGQAFNQTGEGTINNLMVAGSLTRGSQEGVNTVNQLLVGEQLGQLDMKGQGTYNTTTLSTGAQQVSQQGSDSFNRLDSYGRVDVLSLLGTGNLNVSTVTGPVGQLATGGEGNTHVLNLFGDVETASLGGKGNSQQVYIGNETGSATVGKARVDGAGNHYAVNVDGHVKELVLAGSGNQGRFNSTGSDGPSFTLIAGEKNQYGLMADQGPQHIAVRGQGNQLSIMTGLLSADPTDTSEKSQEDIADIGGVGTQGVVDLGPGNDTAIIRQVQSDQPFEVALEGGAGRNRLQLEGNGWQARPMTDEQQVSYIEYKLGNQTVRAYNFDPAESVPVGTHPPDDMPFVPNGAGATTPSPQQT